MKTSILTVSNTQGLAGPFVDMPEAQKWVLTHLGDVSVAYRTWPTYKAPDGTLVVVENARNQVRYFQVHPSLDGLHNRPEVLERLDAVDAASVLGLSDIYQVEYGRQTLQFIDETEARKHLTFLRNEGLRATLARIGIRAA